MSDISWADGVRILQAARDALSSGPAGPGPADQPVTTPPPEYHKSILTDDQAQGFQLLMNILGHNGDTVGRGSTRDLLGKDNANG